MKPATVLEPEQTNAIDFGLAKEEAGPKCEVYVRLSSSCWSDKRGVHLKRSITYLNRRCMGCNFLREDVANIGAEEVLLHITELPKSDGVYKVVTVNEREDWETGHVEDYDYALCKVEGETYA